MGALLSLFGFRSKKKDISLGIYGICNAGKSTLANHIGRVFANKEEISTVSPIPHETREVQVEHVNFSHKNEKINLTLLDMPGISTRVDWKDFKEKYGLSEEEALSRAKEATRGVIEAIKQINNVDVAVVMMDATMAPFDQVNFTILGNIEHQKKPIIVVANKIDLPEATPEVVRDTFSNYTVVEMSALTGAGFQEFCKALVEAI